MVWQCLNKRGRVGLGLRRVQFRDSEKGRDTDSKQVCHGVVRVVVLGFTSKATVLPLGSTINTIATMVVR